jgi:hypothetical protein
MRVFQFRGHNMQAEMFKQRSQKLQLRVMVRIWRDKVIVQRTESIDPARLIADGGDRAHTAPITPKRSTRKYLWRTLNSR